MLLVRFVFLIVTLFSVSLAAAKDNELLIGYENRPPFHYVGNDGYIKGIDIDLANAIFELAEVKIRFKEFPWKRVLYLLENGSVDVAMGAGITDERKRYAWFPKESYRDGYNAMFIREADKAKFANVTTLSDLLDKNIGIAVKLGSSYSLEYEKLITNKLFERKLNFQLDDKSNFELLANNRVDAVLAGEFTGYYAISNLETVLPIIKYIHLYGEEEAATHLMFSKKSVSEETVNRIDDAIKKFKATEAYNKILDKHRFFY